MSASDSPLPFHGSRGSGMGRRHGAPRKQRKSGRRIPARACSQTSTTRGPALEDGPPLLVAVIGDPAGRWSPAHCKAGKTLEAAWADAGLCAANPPLASVILGFAVVQSWRFTMTLDSPTVNAMFDACRRSARGRRQRVGALSHLFLSACALESPVPVPSDCVAASVGNGVALGEQARRLTEGSGFVMFRNQSICADFNHLDAVLQRWRHSGVVAADDLHCCVAWPLWTPLASLVVKMQWSLDMTPVFLRDTRALPQWRAPVQPPDLQMRLYKRWFGGLRCIPTAPVLRGSPSGSHIQRFKPQDHVAVLKLAQFLASQRSVQAAVATALEIGDQAAAVRNVHCHVTHVPHWTTTARARARLDVCAMLAQRQSGAAGDFRYLFFDASPQGSGREVFCCAERVICRGALESLDACTRGAPVLDRRLPVCGLGQGRTALEDKVACLVHQLWLEYGPAASDIRVACRSVRGCLSDMGVEFGICDFPDVVDALLEDRLVGIHAAPPSGLGRATSTAAAAADPGFLFPLALKVPGIRHIVDWILQRAVQRCPWWEEWQSQCKELMHCLHSARQREALQHWLGQQALGNRDELAASLARAPPNFAAWRWNTLSDVVASFLRMEAALRTAAASADAPALFESRQGAAASIRETLVSGTFADRARGLRELMDPLIKFTQWLGRCPCHGASTGTATCPWKGCIGPQLALRVSDAVAEFQGLRDRCLSRAAGGRGRGESLCLGSACVPGAAEDIALSAELAMSDILAKFHWVSEPPYLVWQARSRPRLRARDSVLRVGPSPDLK